MHTYTLEDPMKAWFYFYPIGDACICVYTRRNIYVYSSKSIAAIDEEAMGEEFGWVRDIYFNQNMPNDAFIYSKVPKYNGRQFYSSSMCKVLSH